jgi:hydroxyacyl-ACP dehydratase HTD2-like protein with hotdog domain
MERELTDYVLQGEHTVIGLNKMKINWTANYVTSEQNEPDLQLHGIHSADQ